jgi:membrane protein implicated in regulation of membrane protease activity
MWIVAIGWMYVVTLMAATEPTVVGGIMTFFGYGVLPLSLLLYLMGAGRRARRRTEANEANAREKSLEK